MTDTQMISQLLQTYGSLGMLIAVAGYALRYLQNKLYESQEKRVADAQSFSTKLLQLVDEQHKQIDLLAKAIDGSTDGNHELRTLIERVLDERARVSAPRRAGV